MFTSATETLSQLQLLHGCVINSTRQNTRTWKQISFKTAQLNLEKRKHLHSIPARRRILTAFQPDDLQGKQSWSTHQTPTQYNTYWYVQAPYKANSGRRVGLRYMCWQQGLANQWAEQSADNQSACRAADTWAGRNVGDMSRRSGWFVKRNLVWDWRWELGWSGHMFWVLSARFWVLSARFCGFSAQVQC